MTKEDFTIYKPSDKMRELRLLEELEKNPIVSQRELSHKFGIALGVTNACLKRMARKGLIRIRDLNHRRIGYYLTAKGFSEKAKLTLHLFSYVVHHYSELKRIIAERLLVDRLHRLLDWTHGCIAVTNEEIEQIWRAVPDGTPIDIRP